MLLALDVRNTHTVVGLIAGSGEHAKGRTALAHSHRVGGDGRRTRPDHRGLDR